MVFEYDFIKCLSVTSMLEGQSGVLSGRNTGELFYIPGEQEADKALQQHFTQK